MLDSLTQLEAKRTDLFRQLSAVGDLRRGSITTTSGKCGKPNCHCAQRDDPGHGPSFRLTRRVKGKTRTETFDSAAALRKAQQEVAEFHRFQKLCGEIVEVSVRSDHNQNPPASAAGTNTPGRPPRSKNGPPTPADLGDNLPRSETLQIVVTCVK